MTITTAAKTTAHPEMYFYIPGKSHPQDMAFIPAECMNADTTPTVDMYRGAYSRKTLAEYKLEYPTMLLLTWEEVEQQANEAVKQPVSEITEEKYSEMLEVLPPINWRIEGSNASFMLMEMYSGNVTDIFARICVVPNTYRFFRLRDLCTLKHSEIVERCQAFMEK